MGAVEDFCALIETTDVMRQVIKSLKEEPMHLLALICRDYETAHEPVPDHRVPVVGYIGQAALKALISAGMVKRQSGGQLALYTYEPTAEGLSQYEKLKGGSPGPSIFNISF
jgi:hypothetical protein